MSYSKSQVSRRDENSLKNPTPARALFIAALAANSRMGGLSGTVMPLELLRRAGVSLDDEIIPYLVLNLVDSRAAVTSPPATPVVCHNA